MADDTNKEDAGLSRDDVLAIARAEMQRAAGSGDTPNLDAMAQRLADEKIKLAEARAQVASVQAKIPADGAVVLTGDEATAYTALKGRDGFADAPLTTAAERLDQGAEAIAEAAQIKTQAVQDAALRAAGYDPEKTRRYAPALAEAARMAGEGDAAKGVFASKDDGGTETLRPLDEVVQADYAEIAPVIALASTGSTVAQRGGSALPGRSAAASAPASTSRLARFKERQQASTDKA